MSQYHRLDSNRYLPCRQVIGKKFRAIKNISLVSTHKRTIIRKDKIVIIKGVQLTKPKWWEKYLCCRSPQINKVTIKVTSNANNYKTSGFGNQNDDQILFYFPQESDPIFHFLTKGSETKVAANTRYII